MLKKSSSTPHGRLLCLFDILDDWLDLLNVTQLNSAQNNILEQVKTNAGTATNSHKLQDYLAFESAKAGAAMPEMLANQLYFMAISATQERLQSNAALHEFESLSNHAGFVHAKSAAHALIVAQTKQEFHLSKSTVYGIAASFLGAVVVAGALYSSQNASQQNKQGINLAANAKSSSAKNMPIQAAVPQLVSAGTLANPEQTAALMAQVELMRHGNCQLIEAIQLPDQYKGIYLNMVVNGQISTNPAEQKIAFALLKQTRCNYAPMLMQNSK